MSSGTTKSKGIERPLSQDEIARLHQATGIEPTLETREAAAVIKLRPQTLRRWAALGEGPIKPRRVGGRLRWAVSDLQRLVSGAA